ncbi:unnamed protein product [Xylocopa violacea]|uniref:Retinol dehydrogenase 12-like n=1 Tax=Xylocopa violacea TaxID=135666 RepID=A0ABP1P7M5_XYLVO
MGERERQIVRNMRFFSSSCRSNVRLPGKTVVVTGANCGIGKETAKDLYRRGARVILACRDTNKAKEAVNDIKERCSRDSENDSRNQPGELEICQLNLSDLKSVRKCAQHLLSTESAIHILINNAGTFLHPFEKTADGFETHFQVNHLSHFLFTLLLLPKIRESGPGCRIINVSSLAHKAGDINFEDINSERSYSSIKAYAQSKLANILFTKELDNKLRAAGIQNINVYTLHPGVVSTNLARHVDRTIFRGAESMWKIVTPFVKTAKQGSQTSIYCAVDDKVGNESGLYYDNCKAVRPSARARNPELAKKLWKYSCEVLGLPNDMELEELLRTLSREEAEQ